jgi:ABC-type multidrug transport system fused ATPase/permease subunit
MNRYSLVAHGVRLLLPFSEAIAVRMLVVATMSFLGLAAFLVLLAAGAFALTAGAAAACVALVVLFLSSFVAFVVLFSGFSQGSAIAMKGVSIPHDEPVVRGAWAPR